MGMICKVSIRRQFVWCQVVVTVVMYRIRQNNSHFVQGIPLTSTVMHFKAQLPDPINTGLLVTEA